MKAAMRGRGNIMSLTSHLDLESGDLDTRPGDVRQGESGPDMATVYVLDPNGIIIDTNEVVAPLTGFPPEQLLGNYLASFFDTKSGRTFAALLNVRA